MRHLMMTIPSVALFLCALAGCQTDQNRTADAGDTMAASEARAIAADMTAHLAEQLPPQQTALSATNDGSAFSVALADSLKSSGYSLTPGGEAIARPVLKLTYSAFQENGTWLAQLSVPTVTLSRAYLSDGTGTHPSSPLSALHH